MLRKNGSSRRLLGIKSIEDGYILREDSSEIYFFKIQPYNLAVLSNDVIENKIDAFTEILKVMDEMSIFCLDGSEDFSSNKNNLKRRINEETNPAIKKLLQKEYDEVTYLQQNSTTSRVFLLAFRILQHRKKEDMVKLHHMISNAKDTGLMISQYTREDIMKLMQIYHKQDNTTDYLFDVDGEQYILR
jgi:hypothetical protein